MNGAATLAGGTVDVQAEEGNYVPATRYTILNASSRRRRRVRQRHFESGISDADARIRPDERLPDCSRATTSHFASVASTANQREVSNALDRRGRHCDR